METSLFMYFGVHTRAVKRLAYETTSHKIQRIK